MKRNRSRVVASVDFSGSTRSGDADGHGTGVAGVAAGSGEASTGYAANYAGVAPGADIIDVRVLDENGMGRTSNVLAAFELGDAEPPALQHSRRQSQHEHSGARILPQRIRFAKL